MTTTEPSTSFVNNEPINVATEEGRRRLAELAANGPIFKVRHACDQRTD